MLNKCSGNRILKLFMVILLIINIMLVSGNLYFVSRMAQFLSILQNKINLIELIQINRVRGVLGIVENNMKIIAEELKEYKKIDLPNQDNIKKANIRILNYTKLCSVSGTHIKINDISYILTCYHLLDSIDDDIMAVIDESGEKLLEIIKHNKKLDLLLLRIYDVPEDLPSLEISGEEPNTGSVVHVVGNPSSWNDIITEGTITKIKKYSYLFTNKIYFGNSGGAVLYKEKIIGVTSRIYIQHHLPFVFVNYGYSSNLRAINEFLKDMI